MEIKYKNSKDDFVRLYEKNINTLKILRNYKLFVRFAGVPLFLIIYIIIGRPEIIKYRGFTSKDIFLIILFTSMAIIWAIGYTYISKLMTRGDIKKEIDDYNINFQEELTLSFKEEGILLINNKSHNLYMWQSIKNVIDNEDYIYIIIKNNIPVIIPKVEIDKEVIEQVLKVLREKK